MCEDGVVGLATDTAVRPDVHAGAQRGGGLGSRAPFSNETKNVVALRTHVECVSDPGLSYTSTFYTPHQTPSARWGRPNRNTHALPLHLVNQNRVEHMRISRWCLRRPPSAA